MTPLSLPLSKALTRPLSGPRLGMDTDVAAYISASGATDSTGLLALTAYLKAQSLWSNFRLYPLKSAQNAGSGSTAYGLGGLTTNDMTLVNSPTWGATGVTMDAISQYGIIDDFLDSAAITVFVRATSAATSGRVFSKWGADGSRSFYLRSLSGYRMYRSSDGTNTEVVVGGPIGLTDKTLVAQWMDSADVNQWIDKVDQNVIDGALTSTFDGGAPIALNCYSVDTPFAYPFSFHGGEYHALGFVRGALSDAQREAITDLINAL